jgi:hypothetical protein
MTGHGPTAAPWMEVVGELTLLTPPDGRDRQLWSNKYYPDSAAEPSVPADEKERAAT